MSAELKTLLALAVLAAVAVFALAAFLTVRLIRTRRILKQAGVPLEHKAAYWGALLYTLSPVDLLPDPVYLDDIGVLLLALHVLQSSARTRPAGPGVTPDPRPRSPRRSDS
ncbi:YkvA family protein [Streptomyces varsoviensis]|uniref:YkvA family protein n=1 Tax=Streptomyces varsoviensis TaxID=67373 RepID=UPI0004C97E1E|nr:YkvA family protein [Streptomyces varsoviensis]